MPGKSNYVVGYKTSEHQSAVKAMRDRINAVKNRKKVAPLKPSSGGSGGSKKSRKKKGRKIRIKPM